MRLIDYQGHKFYVENPEAERVLCTFTNHEGKVTNITGLFLHDPELHVSQRLTTIRSVLKWWINNREAIKQSSMVEGAWDSIFYQVYRYFDYVSSEDLLDGDYETCKESLSGSLINNSLSFQYPRSTTSNQFLLCVEDRSEEEGQTIPTYFFALGYLGTIVLSNPTGEASRQSTGKWNNHYNYTFEMNPDDFNWFRSVSKESNVYFGMELEISSKLTPVEIQHIITDVEPKQEPFFIFKRDSTITGRYEHMLEIVTVPCTPRYLRKNWKIFFQKLDRLVQAKGKSISDFFDTSNNLNNGLHIHVSKDSFLPGGHSKKFLTAWHQWDSDAMGIISDAANRPSGYDSNRWCSIDPAYKKTLGTTSKVAGIPKFERQRAQRSLAKRLKGIECGEKYRTAHDRNSATIEVRVYQGIFEIGHIIRSISFTEAMFEYCQNIGYTGFDANFARVFTGFIRKNPKFKAIHNIFKYSKPEGDQTQCA